MDFFCAPAKDQSVELIVNRSRFIASVGYVADKTAAEAFLQDRRLQFDGANHHCWAAIFGAPDDFSLHDQSDDGEPRGSAGKPILNVLQHAGLGRVMVVVTRYFGGRKLGVGGLVRAYSQSTVAVIDALITREVFIGRVITVDMPYDLLDIVEYWLQKRNCEVIDRQFGENVVLNIQIPASEIDALQVFARGTCCGRLQIRSELPNA